MYPQLTAHFSSLGKNFKTMVRTVNKKWFTEDSGDSPDRIKTDWQISIQIIWYDSIMGCSHGDVRFKVTTEGCYKLRLSSKTWCVMINIRSHICGNLESIEANIDTIGLGKRDIRSRHFLRLRLRLRNFILGAYIIEHILNILLCLDLFWKDTLHRLGAEKK